MLTPARNVGKVKGRSVKRFKVFVLCNNSRKLTTERIETFSVLSYTAADAANYIRDKFAFRPETEIQTMGPKGGIVSRYVGWETAVGNLIMDNYAQRNN